MTTLAGGLDVVADEKNKIREESGMFGPVTREAMVLLSGMGRSI